MELRLQVESIRRRPRPWWRLLWRTRAEITPGFDEGSLGLEVGVASPLRRTRERAVMSVGRPSAMGFRGKHALRRRPADAETARTLLECAPSGISAELAARIMDLDESRLMAVLRRLSLDGHAVEVAPGRWTADLAPASSGG